MLDVFEGAPGRFVGDRYHIVRELGRGGMGVVYLGRDLRLDMDVAIKFRGVPHSDATLWLKREFRAVASLRHPNLVELYELVAHERTCYFTMEYLPGIDPRRWVEAMPSFELSPLASHQTTHSALPLQEAHGTELTALAPAAGAVRESTDVPRIAPQVDFARIRAVLAQLAEGLAFLHAAGVIHRDIKPSNVMIVDGVVKLLDFGLAMQRRRMEEELARETRLVGTASYLAPEYVSNLIVSPAMDVYALGVLAFELVTGAPPFGGTLHVLARLHRKSAMPRARSLNPDVGPELDLLIDRMMAADPSQRPTAHEVAMALTGSLTEPPRVQRAPRFVGRSGELDRIADRIADPEPRARLVLVTGPSGVGKSALIDEAVGRARDAETMIWRGRCHQRERVPYRAFDLIIDDLATELIGDPRLARDVPHVSALARVFPVLAPLIDPTLDEPAAADLRVERERALIAMTQLIHHAMHAPRGVIVIDDLQWADDDSLDLLAWLVERATKPLAIIASWTTATTDASVPETTGPLLDRFARLAEHGLDVIDLPAMGDDDLAELIGDLAPRAPTSRLADAARLAAGSPYLAELIGRELGDAGVADPNDAEVRRLERLDPAEREVAELAALAGGAASFEQLKAITDLPAGRLQSILRGLQDVRLVRAAPSVTGDPVYVFYHQRLREAAHDAMSPDVRRARHRKFAGWYERTPSGEPAQLAYHWQHAGDPSRAAFWAMVAADAARAQLAWGLAADWYGKAIVLGADDPRAARIARAECWFLAGKLALAAAEFQVLAGSTRDGDPWRVRAAEAYLKLGEIERGLGVLDEVLARRGEHRTRNRALSVARAALVASRWLNPLHRVRPLARAETDPVRASAYRVIASFLSTPHPIEALEYVLRGVLLAERTGDRDAHSQGLAMLAAYLAAGTLGRFGDRALASAERLATQSGAPYPSMVASGCAGIIAMLRGDWTGMRTAHESGERICRRLGLDRSWEASFLRSYWGLGEVYAGEPVRALALLDDLAESTDDLFSRAIVGSYRGRALVLANQLPAAHVLAQSLDRTPVARRGMAAIYHHVFAGELALAEHDWSRAAAIADELAITARAQWLTAMPVVSAMIDVVAATAALGQAASGDRAAAARTVAIARRLHRRGSASFYAVTALRLWSQGETLLGNTRRARRLLDRASALAPRCGGKVDRLALSGLAGSRTDPGPLGPAVAWSTGGVVTL